MHDDGEDNNDVCGGEDPAVGGGGRDGEGESQAEASAETTPAERGDGAAVLLAECADGSESQGDNAEANGEYDDDGDQAGSEVSAVEGDGKHFEAEEDEEQRLPGCLGALAVRSARKEAPDQVVTIVAAAGSFAALSFVFSSPLIAAVIPLSTSEGRPAKSACSIDARKASVSSPAFKV